MLAQNFKTPTALGLSDIEFDALLKVLGMLERGELRHRLDFNMAQWCGTACCIGGWAERIGKLHHQSLADLSDERTGLKDLFYPDDVEGLGVTLASMAKITAPEAAIALRNYLTHGEPRWAEALV